MAKAISIMCASPILGIVLSVSPGAPGAYGVGHATGSRYITTWEDFTAEYEKTAAHPRTQIMHTGGTHGYTLNRGTQTPPGYALAAQAPDLTSNAAH